MKKVTLFFIFLLLGFTYFQAQNKIPFRLTKDNNIIIKTLVNEKDSLHLMLQMSMPENAISPNKKRKVEHIVFDKNEMSDGNTIQIGKLKFDNARFFNNELSGNESDGKIGTDIFTGKAFKINYDKNRLEIFKKTPNTKGYMALSLHMKNGQFFISAENTIDGKKSIAHFLLQSGFSGGILYSHDFSDENDLNNHLKVTNEKIFKNSMGKSIVTKQGTLPSFKIGNMKLENVPAGFFIGEVKTQHSNYMGADLLKRFNWIFDAERKMVYIKPSKYFDEPFLVIK